MKQAFSGIILLFIVFLLTVYLVLPKYTQFKDLKDEVAKEELVLQQKQVHLLSLQKITEDLETHKDLLEKVNSALPRELSLPGLLNYFQLTAAENGLLLKNINQALALRTRGKEEEGPPPNLQEGYFNLVLKGKVSSFENFLKVLESSSRLLEVEVFSLERHAGGQLPEYGVLVKAHSFKPEAQPEQ